MKMKEEEKLTPYLYYNSYTHKDYAHMPFYIVDRDTWEFVFSHPIKSSDGWFAKTIGRTFVYKRRSKNVFYRFDNNLIELKDCPNGRFIYVDSSGNHALGFKGVEYSIAGPKPSAECFRHLFPDIADDVFDNEGKLISLTLFQLVYPLRDDDEYPGNLMTKTQVDPESGLDITFSTDNPKYDVETGAQNVHFGMPPDKDNSPTAVVLPQPKNRYKATEDSCFHAKTILDPPRFVSNDPNVERTTIRFSNFDLAGNVMGSVLRGELNADHSFPLKYPGLTPEVCAQLMEQKPKRKYTKNKLRKRKKYTKKRKD